MVKVRMSNGPTPSCKTDGNYGDPRWDQDEEDFGF